MVLSFSCWSHRLLDGMFTRQSDGLEPKNDDFQAKFKILEIQIQMVTFSVLSFQRKGWIRATLLVSLFMIHSEILGMVSCPVAPGRDLFSFLEDEHPTNASNSPQSLKPQIRHKLFDSALRLHVHDALLQQLWCLGLWTIINWEKMLCGSGFVEVS